MNGGAGRIGSAMIALEVAPAAAFGSAVAYSAALLLAMPPLGVVSVALGTAAFAAAWLGLHKFAGAPQTLFLPEFESALPELQSADAPVLTSPDNETAEEPCEDGELLLDDVLAEVDPAARVVRLFQAGESPTPGELRNRIERHLHSTKAQALPDATLELHEAIAALRRSLR